jgi:hypothetical protein
MENKLMNRLILISRLMRKCDSEGELKEREKLFERRDNLSDKEKYTVALLRKIKREQIMMGRAYVQQLGGSHEIPLSCAEDVIKQWLDYVGQSADFWNRWQWKCFGLT